jgi:heme o synthase
MGMNRHRLRHCLQLAKAPLCVMVGLSSMFGYLLYLPRFSWELLGIGGGIFFLACGAACLNSLQEQKLDQQLNRTSNRPLPQGELSRTHCLLQSVLLIAAGSLLLYDNGGNSTPLLLGLANLIIYNLVYTTLKPYTTLAIFPGALSGAIPPVIGWLAAGGTFSSPVIILVMATFLLWQIPHYWLVILRHKQDYRTSTLPSLLHQFSEARLQRLLFIWVMAYASISLLFGVQPSLMSYNMHWVLLGNICSMLMLFIYQLWLRPESNYRLLFLTFNTSLITTMLIVISGRCKSDFFTISLPLFS